MTSLGIEPVTFRRVAQCRYRVEVSLNVHTVRLYSNPHIMFLIFYFISFHMRLRSETSI